MDDQKPMRSEKLQVARSALNWRHPGVVLAAMDMPEGLAKPITATLRCGRLKAWVELPVTATRDDVYRRLRDVAEELAEANERILKRSRLIYD